MADLKAKARFILIRLKHITIAETFNRVAQFAWSAYLKSWGMTPAAPLPDTSALQDLQLPPMQGNPSSDTAMNIIRGERYTLHQDMDMIRTYEQDNRVPSPDVRRQDDVIDIRAVWEPARLQHVSVLLRTLTSCPDRGLAQTAEQCARDQIIGWINENPLFRGPHYLSVMECGLRIPVFLSALLLLTNLSEAERQRIISAVYEHAWLISRKLSLYSSLGNHTICESVGLIYAGGLFKDQAQGRRWLEKGIGLLHTEIRHQILNDGGPAEQSLNYHRFVLDLYWMAIGFLELNGLKDCAAWKKRLTMGEHFLSAFMDKSGNLPSIGDSDDGHAIAPGLKPQKPIPVLETKPYRVFNDAGYTIMYGKKASRLIFDHGPLGMAPLYNHGHADALSIILDMNDRPLLVDPGTFRYNGAPEWRRYFKSTRSHNTVCIDGLDQAVQETGFIWSRPYTVDEFALREMEPGFEVQARHNGYSRLNDAVWHRRTINAAENCYMIFDTFEGSGVHEYELNFHVHPDAVVKPDGIGWCIQNSHSKCTIGLEGGDVFNHVKGQTNPFILGWFSPAYGIKIPASVLCCRKQGRPQDVTFKTVIAV